MTKQHNYRVDLLRCLLGLVWLSAACSDNAVLASETATKVLGAGTRWQTPYYVQDSGIDGPTVLVTGGVHGNEPAGARAAEQIRHWPIQRGRLIVIPRVNRFGLQENTRFIPNTPTDRRDLNRNFPDGPEAQTARGEIASALWQLVRDVRPDWLFDLHEGYEFNISHQPKSGKAKSVGSSVIYKKSDDMDVLANKMRYAANTTVSDPERKFVLLSRGPKRTTLASAAIHVLETNAMILETTFNFQRLPVRTRQHRHMMNAALTHLGMLREDCTNVLTPTAATRDDKRLYIGLYDDSGSSDGGVGRITQLLDKSPELVVVHLDAHDMQPNVLSQLDAVVFSGGSGSKQAASLGKQGAAAVREFVESGGGYVGVCAGAYLCSAHYTWSLKLVDTHVFTGSREIEGVGRKQMWYRGKSSSVKMQLTDAGRKLFADIPEHVEVRYQNGPIVSPKKMPGLAEYKTLAYFRSEKVLYEPQKGTMIDTPAIVSGKFGRGQVISISPHPESTAGLESMIDVAIRAVAQASPESN